MGTRILTIALNPSIDVTLWTDGLLPDATNRVTAERREAGGKAINVARVLNTFGQNVVCLAVVGEDNAREFSEYLKSDGLCFELLNIPGMIRENLTLRVGDETVKLNRRGPALSRMMIGALMQMIKTRLQAEDIAVFSGSLPENVDAQDFAELVLATKQTGARVVLDCDALRPEHIQLIRPWLIKPNIHELRTMLSRPCDTEESILQAAHDLQEMGVENALISMGSSGVICASAEGVFRTKAPKVEVKSTVAAGDSTVGGFITGFVNGQPIAECLRLAVACGTDCVTHDGSTTASREGVEALLKNMVTEKLG